MRVFEDAAPALAATPTDSAAQAPATVPHSGGFEAQAAALSPDNGGFAQQAAALRPAQPVGPSAEGTPAGGGLGQERLLRRGSRGPDVAKAQERLNRHGASPALDPDGIFGAKTQRAVYHFQVTHGLSPDAIIGPMTGGALEREPQGNTPPVPGRPPGPGRPGHGPPGLGPPGPGVPTVPPRPGPPGVPGPNKFSRPSNLNSRVDYDSESQGRDIEGDRLPFVGDGETWRGRDILAVLTQVDRLEETETDMFRCVANSTLAIAIMDGPSQVIIYSMNIAGFAQTMAEAPGITPERKALCEAVIAFATGFQQRVGDGTATFADLSRMADYAKQLTVKPKDSTNVAEMLAMQGGSGFTTQPIQKKVTSRAILQNSIANDLQPGEAVTLGVDINTWDGVRDITLGDADHMVVIGKDASGQVYLYDPLPRRGSQYMTMDDPQFWSLFEGDHARPGSEPPFKPAFAVAITRKPPAPGR